MKVGNVEAIDVLVSGVGVKFAIGHASGLQDVFVHLCAVRRIRDADLHHLVADEIGNHMAVAEDESTVRLCKADNAAAPVFGAVDMAFERRFNGRPCAPDFKLLRLKIHL